MSETARVPDPDGFVAPAPYVPLPARIAVLLSGRGSNFEALATACADGSLPAGIVLVASDNPGAAGLERARARGLRAVGFSAKELGGKAALEERLQSLISESRADLICLAGYMKILSPGFVARFPFRILNIHPALLPSFPGLHAQEQAVRYGVRVTGVTVHFVDSGTDTGPIVDQKAVSVLKGDDGHSLAARILPIEHELYVGAVRRVLQGGWTVKGRAIVFP
jgi:phosphoribosylglycinamide formyltransferase-1